MPKLEMDQEIVDFLRYRRSVEQAEGQHAMSQAVQFYDSAEQLSELAARRQAKESALQTLLAIAEALAAVDGEPPVPDLRAEDGWIVEVGHGCPELLRLTPAQARVMAAELVTLADEIEPPGADQ